MDENLKLLVIEELYYKDDEIKSKVDAIDVSSYHAQVGENKKYGWFSPISEIAELLLSIEINDEKLSQVTWLSGESCKVHKMIMPNWDGEGSEFNIKSLSGIDKMKNLKRISFVCFEDVEDQALLMKTRLEELDEFYGLKQEIVDELKNQGVKI